MFKSLKCSNAIRLRKYLSTIIDKKQDFSMQDEVKFKMNSNSNHYEKFNCCIKNGLTSNAVLSNEWIFKMNFSKKNYEKLTNKWSIGLYDLRLRRTTFKMWEIQSQVDLKFKSVFIFHIALLDQLTLCILNMS